jgi:hypothetical protein
MAVRLAPNLRRDRVSFAGTLRQPLRFREAISALHDVVISDLRYKQKDHTAYRAYLAQEREREAALRRTATQAARQELLLREPMPIPEGLETRFRQLRKVYWDARQKYSNYLSQHDPQLWRLLMPCDPVITVAPDVLFFECFSADESSYGCLTVDRDAFSTEDGVALGTTNVDYSWDLYEEFQQLRSYRQTRFTLDPTGFGVQTGPDAGYREEKIDLPESWLNGFLQLQAAMSLPMRRVPVSREGLYNLLAFLKRHRAKRSPRAIRFELEPGRPVTLVLEPWEQRIVLHSTPYSAAQTKVIGTGEPVLFKDVFASPRPGAEVIRIWGRDRLRVLGRLLPLVERADVYLLGSGLPSFWSVRLGDMRLLLGLSGWTANDWTGASCLEQLAPPAEPSNDLVNDIAAVFKSDVVQTLDNVRRRTGAAPAYVAAGLNRLALKGQLIHDLAAGVYRWRQVLPMEILSLSRLDQVSPETAAAQELVARGRMRVTREEQTASGLRVLFGDGIVQVVLDADGRMVRGKCTCSHHYQFGVRRGPCRHLQALRLVALEGPRPGTLERWFEQLWGVWN